MIKALAPSLWFDNQAEEAADFYVSVFPNSKILYKAPYTEAGPGEPGTIMTVQFELNGLEFVAINGGPLFTFSEAISFVITCENQDELDHYWDTLTADGGAESQCGWLKDKYGLSWQVVPTGMEDTFANSDPEVAHRVAKALFSMRKIDIAALDAAAAGVTAS